ncbi:IclR family transcriptional regulator [Peribacillus simplex]|uniref:IclR family transcriptional regulator n=1 Tax=Peribacillus simplex TaxID=1478 RepID=UPI0036DF71B1
MEIVKSGSTIQSLQIGMSIIDLLASQRTPLRFSDIQELTEITKSNLYKYLNTLTQLDLLYRDKTTGMYHLGSKLIQYGMAAIGNEDVTSRITPYLQEISHHTSCTVLFSVWTYDGPITAKIWNSNQNLNIGAQLGTRLPPSSSSGKVFTVFQDPSLTAEWIEKDRNVTGSFLKETDEYHEIRKYKIAFAKEPLVPSVSSMSIPVFNYNSELLGAITAVGFTESIPDHYEDPLSDYLRKSCLEISKIFGYSFE